MAPPLTWSMVGIVDDVRPHSVRGYVMRLAGDDGRTYWCYASICGCFEWGQRVRVTSVDPPFGCYLIPLTIETEPHPLTSDTPQGDDPC